ncbi:solute carrier organic anion transporter family member 4C1-like [Argonauta hians]
MELYPSSNTIQAPKLQAESDSRNNYILRKPRHNHFMRTRTNMEAMTMKYENIRTLTAESRNLRKSKQEPKSTIAPSLMVKYSGAPIEGFSMNTSARNSKIADLRNSSTRETFGNTIPHNLPMEYSSCNPSCHKVLGKSSVVLSLLCISSFLKGFILNGIINVNMSTIEKRFGLTSSQAGWIASVHDITAAPVALIVSFIGAVGYKMRWIGLGLLCLSIGSFIIIIPHFAAGEYKWKHNLTGLCSNKTSVSSVTETSTANFLYVFLLGRLIHGIGCSILHTLGISCVDDCVDPKNVPMYMGIMLCFGTLGPAFGFLIGGEFLKIFVDINSTEVLLSEEDPQWIGAWWLSFLVSAVIALLIVPLMLTYKKELPISKKIENSCSEVHQNTSQKRLAQFGFGSKVKDIPVTAYLLLWNPSFLFVTLTFTTEAALLHGVTTFLPKYLESQYQRTPSQASLLTGIIAVPGGAGGQLLGGYICKRFGLKINQMTRLAIVCFVVSLTTWSVIWIKCDSSVVTDIAHNKPEDRRNSLNFSHEDFTAACNIDCYCSTEFYQPVCGADKKLYFSPCHAGCVDFNKNNQSYANCSCIEDVEQTGYALKGLCKKHGYCYQLLIFLPLLMITFFLTFVARTPLVAVVLRCIPDNQKTFGLGVNHFIRRLVGSLPGPLLFGKALDQSCRIWKHDRNNDSSCWLYNSYDLSFNFFLIFIVLRILSISFLGFASYLYKPPPSSSMSSKSTSSTANNNNKPTSLTRHPKAYDNPVLSQEDEVTAL